MPGEYFSGKDTHFAIEDGTASRTSPPTLVTLSDEFDVETASASVSTDRFVVKPWKAARAHTIAGLTTETWTVSGPTTSEALTHFQPLSNTAEGKNLAFEFGPYNNDAGKLKISGLLDVLDLQWFDNSNADAVPKFSVTLSIHTLNPISTF